QLGDEVLQGALEWTGSVLRQSRKQVSGPHRYLHTQSEAVVPAIGTTPSLRGACDLLCWPRGSLRSANRAESSRSVQEAQVVKRTRSFGDAGKEHRRAPVQGPRRVRRRRRRLSQHGLHTRGALTDAMAGGWRRGLPADPAASRWTMEPPSTGDVVVSVVHTA